MLSHDDAIDALLDLQHDLGKYLRLPLAMCPRDADVAVVEAALTDALRHTRRAGAAVTSAATLWTAFLDEVDDTLSAYPSWARLHTAVAAALALVDDLPAAAQRRGWTEARLAGVSVAIGALLDEVSR